MTKTQRPVVVGVGGGSASGKSTLTAAIADALKERVLLLMHDRYYISLPEHHRHNPAMFNFDHPDALETRAMIADLDALIAGESARLPRYNFATHTRMDSTDLVETKPFILVDGILVLSSQALCQRFDLTIFVDAPEDVRLNRRIHRDAVERGREPAEVLEQYYRTVKPMHDTFVEPSRRGVDLVIDGTAPLQESIESALGLLGQPSVLRRSANS